MLHAGIHQLWELGQWLWVVEKRIPKSSHLVSSVPYRFTSKIQAAWPVAACLCMKGRQQLSQGNWEGHSAEIKKSSNAACSPSVAYLPGCSSAHSLHTPVQDSSSISPGKYKNTLYLFLVLPTPQILTSFCFSTFTKLILREGAGSLNPPICHFTGTGSFISGRQRAKWQVIFNNSWPEAFWCPGSYPCSQDWCAVIAIPRVSLQGAQWGGKQGFWFAYAPGTGEKGTWRFTR